ncbi:MAG: DUF2085 domain-containing protein [Candidatus Aegiribacteria sp.]|nr:DUF2085 domain-containing protein [Candidatus Aegiribacteria sp.]MBD3295488.1 DUF2085 domain-containing protein [Candidatus Fermentibacteria bacterium]
MIRGDVGRSRLVPVLVIGIPSFLMFVLSVLHPVIGDSGFAGDFLSATCHRLPARSLNLPWGTSGLCTRCTAFWFAMAAGSVSFGLFRTEVPFWAGFPALLPLITDGLIQHFTSYESTNFLRSLTGIAAGAGITLLLFGKTRFSKGD